MIKGSKNLKLIIKQGILSKAAFEYGVVRNLIAEKFSIEVNNKEVVLKLYENLVT